MFVEGEVEIKVKDRSTLGFDEHNMKLWVQRAFKELSCYRISSFHIDPDPNDVGLLRSFIEKMFEGKGTCRCVGDVKLKPN